MRALFLSALLVGAVAAPAPAQLRTADLHALVEAVTIQSEGQVARFHEPVCVVAEGMRTDYNAVIEGRVRDLARAAGIEVAEGNCLANLLVMVANDSGEVASVLRRRRPEIFNGMESIEISRAIRAEGPVRSWQSSVTRRAEGPPIVDSRDTFLDLDVHLHHGVPVGLLRETTRRDLQLSVIVFDVDAIDGLTLMQVADHAAMRGLAPTRPAHAAAGHSILGLFDTVASGGQRLPAVTRWDLAYLRALYRTGGAVSGRAHRALLARLVEQNLARGRR